MEVFDSIFIFFHLKNVRIDSQIVFSELNVWTGIIGIVTSHILFYYSVEEKYVQMDIYSCKRFDENQAISYMDSFWKSKKRKSILVQREPDKDFKVIKV